MSVLLKICLFSLPFAKKRKCLLYYTGFMYKSDHWKDEKENNTGCLWEENLMTRLKKSKENF